MLASAAILVIVPDVTFRRSIGFLLESEGCRVGMLESLPSRIEGDGFDCAVVDDSALPRGDGHNSLARLQLPVVLLVDGSQQRRQMESVSHVEKPLLGRVLIDAVRAALPVRDGETDLGEDAETGSRPDGDGST